MTEQELLEKYGFKNFDEVRLVIKMGFPSAARRLWAPVYPSAYHLINAMAFLRRYLETNSVDVMIDWAKGKYDVPSKS